MKKNIYSFLSTGMALLMTMTFTGCTSIGSTDQGFITSDQLGPGTSVAQKSGAGTNDENDKLTARMNVFNSGDDVNLKGKNAGLKANMNFTNTGDGALMDMDNSDPFKNMTGHYSHTSSGVVGTGDSAVIGQEGAIQAGFDSGLIESSINVVNDVPGQDPQVVRMIEFNRDYPGVRRVVTPKSDHLDKDRSDPETWNSNVQIKQTATLCAEEGGPADIPCNMLETYSLNAGSRLFGCVPVAEFPEFDYCFFEAKTTNGLGVGWIITGLQAMKVGHMKDNGNSVYGGVVYTQSGMVPETDGPIVAITKPYKDKADRNKQYRGGWNKFNGEMSESDSFIPPTVSSGSARGEAPVAEDVKVIESN